MILFERGNITKEMYFILQGEVAVAAGLEDDHISAIHRAGMLTVLVQSKWKFIAF